MFKEIFQVEEKQYYIEKWINIEKWSARNKNYSWNKKTFNYMQKLSLIKMNQT